MVLADSTRLVDFSGEKPGQKCVAVLGSRYVAGSYVQRLAGLQCCSAGSTTWAQVALRLGGMGRYPGEGEAFCAGTSRDGSACCMREVRGIGWCLHHVHDELLELAEQIAGFRRCSRCRMYARRGTSPPLCKIHGGPRRNLAVRQMEARWSAIEAQLLAQFYAERARQRVIKC